MIDKIKALIQRLIHFLSYEIWRVNKTDTSSKKKHGFYNIIKTFILAIRNIDGSQLNTRAGALTYSTLLSIVPLLAVLFAIARGFGFQNIVKSQLFDYFSGQKELLEKAIVFIDNSLEYAQGGVFLGIGVILLLYTVVNLLSNIETNFNTIWKIKNGRSYYRMFTDYLALIIIAPVFLICNGGLSIFLNFTSNNFILGLVVSPILNIIPYVIVVFLFTFLYVYIPNTKVKFTSALFGGIFAGIAFQIFQTLYINGQIWISKYNAIYGSFAALPLLLLWLQLSWFICLFGVELCFAYQNINKFSFEKETNHISRRYKDFVLLVLMTLIVKRFESGDKPYTADELSETYKIPTKLTSDSLSFLLDIGIILETRYEDENIPQYIPAIDINQISVSYLFDKVDAHGSEDFKIDKHTQFKIEWEMIVNIRKVLDEKGKMYLLKDL